MRVQVTLYGEDAEQFEAIKSRVGDDRECREPSNAALLRQMMTVVDAEDLR
jgi:hypothetical protein